MRVKMQYGFLAAVMAGCAVGSSSAFGWCGEKPTGELQRKAQELADYAVREGLQGALQFCAFKDGKCVIDVWAGTMTTNAGAAKIDGTTLFPIFSTEKPLLATAVHRTVEEGKLAYDQAVSTVWPEFRGGGKEKLTVRELLGYRSGMPDNKDGAAFSPEGTRIMSDWKAMLEWFASVPPDIVPGTKQRYMAKSYGWAHGGTLEKVWKKPANEVLREQVLIPAGIENDFYFICGDAEIPRIATAYKSKAFESMNDDLARRSFLPSAWAVSNARALAQFYNRLCGFDGKPPLLKKETLDAALKPCRHPSDPVPDAEGLRKWHMIFGMGYGLWGEADDMARVFGHGGIGGSEGLCDRSQRVAIGYTCNFDNAPPKLREAFYSLVGISWRYRNQNVNIQDLQMSTMQSDPTKPARPSVASFCKRAEAGERLTVAFFGGSLTWGANATDPNRTSWRALIGERLERAYPKAHFKFVDAAIGGTGSNLGVFRLARDVLKYRPDLVFIDWAVNDGAYAAADDYSASYEGILRKLLKELPDCVPVQVILPDRKTVELADEAKLRRRAEHIAFGEAFGLSRADVLGEMRRRHSIGRVDLGKVWPAVIGDNTHPFDEGYALYADIIWQQVFSTPSDRTVHVPEAWLSSPKYGHVLRADLAKRTDLPAGWAPEPCSMRAGTFDFLCSRWQDGLAVAREGAAPLKAKFRGEVLLLYGESAVQSVNCEVYVDGKLVAKRDTSDFGRHFAPSAYLVWQIGARFDPSAEHTLEIRPVFKPGEKQELRLGSICVAGREAATLDFSTRGLRAGDVVRLGLD